MKLTHTVQLSQMDFEAVCSAAETFCIKTSLDLEATLDVVKSLRKDARDRDRRAGYDLDDSCEGEEELTIAQDEEWPLIESYSLIGLFGLVLVTSRFDKFLQDVIDECRWRVQRSVPSVSGGTEDGPETKSFIRKLKCLEANGNFSRDDSPVPFPRVQEIFLARNDFLHNRGYAGKDYLHRVATPRFLASDGSYLIEVEASRFVADVLNDLRQFSQFITERCMPFSSRILGRKK